MTFRDETINHMKAMLEPPFTWHWWPHIEREAKRLSALFPELEGIDAVMLAHFEHLKQKAKHEATDSLVHPA